MHSCTECRMISVNQSGYFITGSDTDVGKTYIACELIRQLRNLGVHLETRKPVESGCRPGELGELTPSDALKLQSANDNSEPIDRVVRYRYRAALAPHRAARLEGGQLTTANLLQACEVVDSSHLLIVEGAGGFYSPIAENGLNGDLASLLQLAVIIVVNDRIGAVNQALMSIRAVEDRHLNIAAIILNQVTAEADPEMNNIEDLQAHCSYPIFQCLHGEKLEAVFS